MNIVKEENQIALRVAREFAHNVYKLVPDAIIKLYGSAARGEMEELSDIDIYIELPDEVDFETTRAQISDIAWKVGFEHSEAGSGLAS